MKYLKALVMMQLKNKLDFSFTSSKQKLISKIVFTVLKFVAVTAVAFAFFFLCSFLKLFSVGGGVPGSVMVVIYGLIFLLSLLSCTYGLMKTLYFADDNKILITLPVGENLIFISRLIVYYVFELQRSLFLTIPIFLAFSIISGVGVLNYIWLPIVFIFVSAIPVLLGAILSIPAMYVYRFLQKVPALKISIYVVGIVGVLIAVIQLIALIPVNIDLSKQFGIIQSAIANALRWCTQYLYPANKIVDSIIGLSVSSGFTMTYTILRPQVFIYFALILVALVIFLAISFALSRPLFLAMLSKSFEFEKKSFAKGKPNKKRIKVFSLLKTELSNMVRSGLMPSFLSVYVIVPILIFFINKIFVAIDTRTTGMYMVYAFNLLLILLPMLASNAMVATLFSRDGRAAYIKKSMPVNPVYQLTIKLIPIFVLSSISIICSVGIFGALANLNVIYVILIALSCIAINCGHIVWSASLDLMNPQNEAYATTGEMDDNPNEKSSTISAFIVSALYAFFSFILFSDVIKNVVITACIKLLLIGVVFLIATVYMYVNKIKVYYNEK